MSRVRRLVWRLATGWTVRGSSPGGGEVFRTRPARPRWPTQPPVHWVPALLPGGTAAGASRWPLTHISAEVKERVAPYVYSPSVIGRTQHNWRVGKIAESDCSLRHVCPSVRMEQLGSHWMDFREVWYLSIFRKICRENSSSIKNLTRITGTLHEDQCTFLIYLAQLFLECEMFQTQDVEKTKTSYAQ